MNKYFLRSKITTYLILLYFSLLILFATILRVVDNYLILEFVLTHWKKTTALRRTRFAIQCDQTSVRGVYPFRGETIFILDRNGKAQW